MFRRLSGQVIWALLEENDASQDECGVFMDIFYARFQNLVRVLAKTKSHPDGYIRITAGPAHDRLSETSGACVGCSGCNALAGNIYPASMTNLIEHLPPYSLGCSLSMEFLQASLELSQDEQDQIQDSLPQVCYQLCCPRRPLSRIILEMRQNLPLF